MATSRAGWFESCRKSQGNSGIAATRATRVALRATFPLQPRRSSSAFIRCIATETS